MYVYVYVYIIKEAAECESLFRKTLIISLTLALEKFLKLFHEKQ